MSKTDIIVLFSGGLDSLLAAKLLQEQGLDVLCLHFTSPFFGDAGKKTFWEREYGITVETKDISGPFTDLLKNGPRFGYGKTLNPCVDCKILLLREAKRVMEKYGAKAIASGAVVGQRPMSQRRDVLQTIFREAGVRDCLVRPLSALALTPTPPEESGFIDRSRLLGITGRGRSDQLRLARDHYHFRNIPTPGGGCKLTERENASRYWMVLTRNPSPNADDFQLANTGRQFWLTRGRTSFWLSLGRNRRDNELLHSLRRQDDLLLTFPHIPSPVALARHGSLWPEDVLLSAGQLTLSYAVKALQQSSLARLHLEGEGVSKEETVEACRNEPWALPVWEVLREEIRALRKQKKEDENSSTSQETT